MRIKGYEKKSRKTNIFGLLLVSLFILATLTACGAKSQDSGSDGEDAGGKVSENHLNDRIGGESPFQSVLNAKKLKVEKQDNPCREILVGILRGEKAYQKEHKELLKKISEYINDPELDFPKNKKIYLSLQPVFSWDAMEETVIFSNPCAFFFTEDMKAVGKCSFYSDDREHFEVITLSRMDETMQRTLQEDHALRLLCVGNGEKELVLKEDNTILCGDPFGEIQIKGKYFQKVDDMELSFSYETLFSADKKLLK